MVKAAMECAIPCAGLNRRRWFEQAENMLKKPLRNSRLATRTKGESLQDSPFCFTYFLTFLPKIE